VNPETRAVDEQMDWSIVHSCTKWNLAELLEAPRQGGMVGDGKVHLQHASQGTQGPFGLPERKVEDHTNRQSRLDGDICVGALTAGFPAGRLLPGVDCTF